MLPKNRRAKMVGKPTGRLGDFHENFRSMPRLLKTGRLPSFLPWQYINKITRPYNSSSSMIWMKTHRDLQINPIWLAMNQPKGPFRWESTNPLPVLEWSKPRCFSNAWYITCCNSTACLWQILLSFWEEPLKDAWIIFSPGRTWNFLGTNLE